MPDTPLRPDELEAYKTDVQTEAERPDPSSPSASPGNDARPWILLGLILLAVFVVALLAALAFPLLG